jgi:hypothetical protein
VKDYRILEVGRQAVDHLVRAHYLHRWPGVVTAILALLNGSRPIGVIVFALPPREIFTRYGVSEAWELARLFIEDSTPKNTETWFVARAIRWIRNNRPAVQLLISYADPSANHTGIIYRAGNWIVDGRTDQERKTPRFDYQSTEFTVDAPLLSDEASAKRFSRKGHVNGATVTRVARVSKFRFVYWLDGKHEQRRKASSTTAAHFKP